MSIHEDWKDENPQKKPMSTGLKVALILLAAGGVLMLVCCGGMAFVVNKVKNNISEDPAVVRARTKDVTDIEIPDDFQPVMSMDLIIMKMFVYETKKQDGQTKKHDGMLMIAELHQNFAKDQNAEAQMKDAMNKQGKGQPDLDIIKSETREFEIKGKPASFKFSEAQDPKTKKEFRQVTGSFPGKAGTAMLVLQVPANEYDEEEIVEMIESIK